MFLEAVKSRSDPNLPKAVGDATLTLLTPGAVQAPWVSAPGLSQCGPLPAKAEAEPAAPGQHWGPWLLAWTGRSEESGGRGGAAA